MKKLLLAFTIPMVIVIGQSASACRQSVPVYRAIDGVVSHHSFPIGSNHTLSRGGGRVTVTVGARSYVQGFHLPDGLMGRLGFTSQINSGTACLN
jgi:hypothetical protein